MQERRLHPRFHVTWVARLGREDTRWYDSEVSDISIAGFGLVMSREAVTALAQSGGLLTPGDRIEMRFVAGDGVPSTALAFDCAVKQVRRVSRERYVVGGVFDGMSDEQELALRNAVASLQQTASGR